MRILQVHKYLYRKAGAEAYVLDLVELLKAHGHEVMMWGTSEKCKIKNVKLKMPEDLLVEPLNFDRRDGVWRDLKKFGHMVWSFEVARKFERVLKQFQPDVVHVHNIYHHISPSILRVAKTYGVPVVMTVHDYHLVNPNYALYDHGEICERHGLAAIFHRCIKNSFAASFADVLEWRLHRMMGVYARYVTKFIVPTEFVKEKLVKSGMDKKRIEVVPLPVVYSEDRPPSRRRTVLPCILFAGRLTVEKGIYVLLEMAKRLPEINFKIAGDGPELENVKCKIKNEKLLNVELLGFVEKEKLQRLIARARIVLVPSLWYDPSPLAVLEAMAAGKVVMASKIGGIAELIEDGKTGVLIEPPIGHIGQIGLMGPMIDQLKTIYYDEKLLARVGKAAQEYVRRVHNPKTHYEKVMEIYRNVRG